MVRFSAKPKNEPHSLPRASEASAWLSNYQNLKNMEDWELDFEWLRIRHLVKEATKRDALPDLNGVLLMIGVQELGQWRTFTKEEKQDLMHIAVCRLLSYDGVYEFIGLDTEGWPHYRLVSKPDIRGENGQERLLKEKVVQYFKQMDTEREGMST
ncbi:MAG: hypothetical protein U5L45_00085 [Saprospiraceae bacterium]|nr:hypothetical protein [Saprospiraceae bacterium]